MQVIKCIKDLGQGSLQASGLFRIDVLKIKAIGTVNPNLSRNGLSV